jgi:DNA-binding NarL/FixJ family response regulator
MRDLIDFTNEIVELSKGNPLTKVEIKVLNYLANGMDIKEISTEAGITTASLKSNHFRSIYIKLLAGDPAINKMHVAVSKVLKHVAQKSS